jgi:hypothetical protein
LTAIGIRLFFLHPRWIIGRAAEAKKVLDGRAGEVWDYIRRVWVILAGAKA